MNDISEKQLSREENPMTDEISPRIPHLRDDRHLLQRLGLISKILLGLSLYIPSSWCKKTVLGLLGAKIGKNVYLGPGSLIVSGKFRKVYLDDGVFIGPGVMISVDNLMIGSDTTIGYQCLLVGESMRIGKACNISNRTFLESSFAPVIIGDMVTIGASAIISSHDGSYRQTLDLPMKKAAIHIKDRAFVGNNAIILPGLTIGEKSIIGAGAVVTRDVEALSVVAGVPARVIKTV